MQGEELRFGIENENSHQKGNISGIGRTIILQQCAKHNFIVFKRHF